MEPSETGGMRQLTQRELWDQLSNAASLRSSEDQVLWTISGIFWAANAVLLVALFQGGKLPESNVPPLVVSAVGMTLSAIQYFLQGRALGHIQRYEQLMTRLECALGFAPEYAVSADLNTEDADRYLGGRRGNVRFKVRRGTLVSVRRLMQWTSVVGALAWAAAFGFFLYAAICCA
jgi:hypothetical protein